MWFRSREHARQEGGGWDDTGQPDRIMPEATIARLEESPDCLALL